MEISILIQVSEGNAAAIKAPSAEGPRRACQGRQGRRTHRKDKASRGSAQRIRENIGVSG